MHVTLCCRSIWGKRHHGAGELPQEIREAGQRAAIIEDYPDDKYSPSSLLLGYTSRGRVLHIQVSRADTELARIITLYEPNPDEWVDYSRRR